MIELATDPSPAEIPRRFARNRCYRVPGRLPTGRRGRQEPTGRSRGAARRQL